MRIYFWTQKSHISIFIVVCLFVWNIVFLFSYHFPDNEETLDIQMYSSNEGKAIKKENVIVTSSQSKYY